MSRMIDDIGTRRFFLTRSRSYPYLWIARAYDVDYGDVLSYADWLLVGNTMEFSNVWHERAKANLPVEVKTEIMTCVVEIQNVPLFGMSVHTLKEVLNGTS